MSYEETLVCDGCSTVLDAGSRKRTAETLTNQDGRWFLRGPGRDTWIETTAARALVALGDVRHLCGSCKDGTHFFDLALVPAATPEGGEDRG